MIEIGVLALSCFLNLLLGLVVFFKNPKSTTNRMFLFLACSFAAWSIVNYFSVHPVFFSQITLVRLVLLFAALQSLAFYLTSIVFPLHAMPPGGRKKEKIAILATAFVMFMTQTPFVFRLNGQGEPAPSFAIPLFAILIFTLLFSGIYTLVTKFRRSHGKEKDQLRLILFGFIGTFSLIFLTNFLLVVVFNNTALIPFGPSYTLVFSGSFAYAIVKHRLFDIRAATARGLAYLLSFTAIGLIYGLFVLGVSTIINQQDSLTLAQRGSYIGFALITALVFPRTKQFFDRITNKFFFRDAYDPQGFLDELNTVLVRSVDMNQLLQDTSKILLENLKTDFTVFSIRKTSYSPIRIIGDAKKNFDEQTVQSIADTVTRNRENVIVTDFLDHTSTDFRKVLVQHDVALIVKLKSRSGSRSELIGTIMFGSKKSGNTFNKLDLRMLEIIANELVIAIQNALRFEEIQNFNVTLQEKVNEATRKLRLANEKLRQLDQTKDDFISMASHQLRTPLTSVKGYVSMVLDEDAGKVNPQQRKLLDQAFISSQRMVYLIADLLNVSRLKTGKFIIEPKPTNLADVVESELEQLKETAKGRDLKLLFQRPKSFPTMNLDETKIRQVIMNFSDNAIYYTPAGGTITVSLVDKPESVELTVADNGIGVPKAEQHHLFSKFYRAGNAKKARPDGTGLGLFMAQKVIVAQGGAIIFHSEENKGSTFGFSFPKAKLLVK